MLATHRRGARNGGVNVGQSGIIRHGMAASGGVAKRRSNGENNGVKEISAKKMWRKASENEHQIMKL
jgi:hypothetical protein